MHTIRYRDMAGWDTVSRSLSGPPGRVVLLCGASAIFPISLALAGATGEPFAVIDGAMRFNSYTLARIGASLGITPRALLQRAHVTRSFTAYQTEAALTIKLPRFLGAGRNAAAGCRLAVILGLLDTYYDDQITTRESRQSIGRVMTALQELARQNIHVLVVDVEVTNAPPGKAALFHDLRRAADRVVTLEPFEGSYVLTGAAQDQSPDQPDPSGPKPWDATTIPSPLLSTITAPPGVNSGGR